MRKLTLKALWDGSLTFSISPRISDMEKVFAKKLVPQGGSQKSKVKSVRE
jgi:hypothetical protein